MKIPNFRVILATLAGRATENALRAEIPDGDAGNRFSVVVRPETRAFLAAQANALGSSLAAVSGTILDSVAALEYESISYSRELITSRFYLLLKEHGLSLPAAAEVLRSRQLTAGDMSDPKLLLEKLDTSTLEWLANHFQVRYEWLAGQSEYPVHPRSGSWYKNQLDAAKYLADLARTGAAVELMIAVQSGHIDFEGTESKDDNVQESKVTHFIPIIRVERQAGPRETYTTFEVLEHGRWNYWRCREHIKMVTYFATRLRNDGGLSKLWVRGISLPPEKFTALQSSASLIPSLLQDHSSASWHPDDFVEPWSAVGKDKAEWKSIQDNQEYGWLFRAFEDLVADFRRS